MPIPAQPELTPNQRLEQVAAIFARGAQRYRDRLRRTEHSVHKEFPESPQKGLEVPGHLSVTVSRCTGV